MTPGHFCRFKKDITEVLQIFLPFLLVHPVTVITGLILILGNDE